MDDKTKQFLFYFRSSISVYVPGHYRKKPHPFYSFVYYITLLISLSFTFTFFIHISSYQQDTKPYICFSFLVRFATKESKIPTRKPTKTKAQRERGMQDVTPIGGYRLLRRVGSHGRPRAMRARGVNGKCNLNRRERKARLTTSLGRGRDGTETAGNFFYY